MESHESSSEVMTRIGQRLHRLYDAKEAASLLFDIDTMLKKEPFPQSRRGQVWDQSDVLLITYGNSLCKEGEKPLETLNSFLAERLSDVISGVHILPFFPFSSDDGFSVIDYLQVNPELGDWDDIARIAEQGDLVVDLVINHVSRQSLWFLDYLNDQEPGNRFFIEMDPETDVSAVTRPRATPLLVPVQTQRGCRHLWATFSPDQIDVNFRNPQVLKTYLEILLSYLRVGARMIRLDAVAFLWKELETTCIHRPETHEIVKLIRDVMSLARPDSLIITETNVPHEENVSYFGDGDETHLIYQFALPPLLLHALYRGTSRYLNQWLTDLEPPPEGCTFLNFSASHDGIGLRAVEGLLPEDEVEMVIRGMHRFGGYVSKRATEEGDRPYELNIALFSAMKGTWQGEDAMQVARFICLQTVKLALQGIPSFYFHSLVATMNDTLGVERTGRTRSINRHRWDWDRLMPLLDASNSPNAQVFESLSDRARIRRRQPAFHPEASQTVLYVDDAVLAFRRRCSEQTIHCIHNLTGKPVVLQGRQLTETGLKPGVIDLLTEQSPRVVDGKWALQPYQAVWLAE